MPAKVKYWVPLGATMMMGLLALHVISFAIILRLDFNFIPNSNLRPSQLRHRASLRRTQLYLVLAARPPPPIPQSTTAADGGLTEQLVCDLLMAKRSAPASLDQSGQPAEKAVHPGPEAALSPSQTSSPRVTRSAARLAADSAANTSEPAPPSNPPVQARKRKAPSQREKVQGDAETPHSPSPSRGPKRSKLSTSAARQPATRQSARQIAAMSQSRSPGIPEELSKTLTASPSSSKPRSTRNRKASRDGSQHVSPPRRQKKRGKRGSDAEMRDADEEHHEKVEKDDEDLSPANDSNEEPNQMDTAEEDEHDPFRGGIFGAGSPFGLQSTLRALSGMMSGMSSRLRDILSNLKTKGDPSVQLIALQELSDLLLVSNEDNLAGHFSPDPYVHELVNLMQPNEFGEENPEIMLLACRCLANMMEAIRGSVANVVHGGAVPILCQKLLDIQFIDLAEQALSTLAKISVDFPASIVREGGLTACLTYLDFFPTSTQRTAVTTAANCCRNVPQDSFPVVKEVMPTLLNVLSSSDQKVVEQGCLCVCRVVESFKYKPEQLEELIEPDLLRAVLRLLLPGTTNLIGPHIHTYFLRVLGIICKSSPRLSVELLKMNVVDTLYQILTGVSPPSDDGSGPMKSDSVHIMQALIHRPREQVYETLNVVYEILPGVSKGSLVLSDDQLRSTLGCGVLPLSVTPKIKAMGEKRLELLKQCQPEIRRFTTILLPTLTDVYSSTVNLRVRQKVLLAQLKMVQALDVTIIEEALRSVPYASFLAGILSQKDHISLVALALQCAELLFERLREIYQYQFHREGVITEIKALAETPLLSKPENPVTTRSNNTSEVGHHPVHGDHDMEDEHDHDSGDENELHDEAHDHDDESNDEDGFNGDYPDEPELHRHEHDDASDSETSSIVPPPSQSLDTTLQDLMTTGAKHFLRLYEDSKVTGMHEKAELVLETLRQLATKIEACYKDSARPTNGYKLFCELATYFDGNALDSITSFELLNSGIIRVLLDVIEGSKEQAGADFLKAFTSSPAAVSPNSEKTTAFGTFIHKLQDLLSRTENFEVVTVHHNAFDNRSTLSMLSKQIRLRLVAEEDSNIPKPYKNMMVSIHAIANFKTLDDYLRPRISLSERPRNSRHRDPTFSHLTGGAYLQDPESTSRGNESGLPHFSDFPSYRLPTARGNSSGTSARGANKGRPTPPSTLREDSGEGQQEGTGRRRSARHQPPPPPMESDDTDGPLECADETHISDEEEDDDEEDALDTIVDDIDDDLSEDEAPDPSAVNMEVASTGKVTARKEDGTRVSTPSQSTPVAKSSSSLARSSPQSFGRSLSLAGRSFTSYAAAMVAMPQDWHIEFSLNGKPISNDTTVYRAVHGTRGSSDSSASRNVWSAVHTVHFKRAQGPQPPEPSTLTPTSSNLSAIDDETDMPESLNKAPTTASILRLLRVLHYLNSQSDDDLVNENGLGRITPEPPSLFINTKLTAKLNRQLEEPLIVASSCLPSWSEDLGRHFAFLFPFETRHLFLQSTSFGYARSMIRWQGSQSSDESQREHRRDDRAYTGRLQRQKVRISRTRILDSAMKVLELYGSSPSVLEIEYFEEVGTGLGPTLEFYSTVSREFSKKKLKLWRDSDANTDGEYVNNKLGLFPAPMSHEQTTQEAGKKQLQHFKALGKFVARSMLDSRIIDIGFNPLFFSAGRGAYAKKAPSISSVKRVDPELANSLMLLKKFADKATAIKVDTSLSAHEIAQAMEQCEVDNVKLADLGLDFVLPGYPSIKLVPDGDNTLITMSNVELYVSKVIDMTLGSGIKPQLDAFAAGFSQVFLYSSLKAFTPEELVMLFGQVDEDWSIETLMDSIKADHGFNMDSRSVRNLLETLSGFTLQQRRDFLQFVTGSPKLPIGGEFNIKSGFLRETKLITVVNVGFKGLTPMFTVVCRPSEPPYTPDDYLPSVMTCVNYLKLPDYSSAEVLLDKLGVAMREGQGAFHLS
ncbi:serine/threonine protein kinase [Arthroderma uncinatum]|uniref:serine/threonine protein kinase n=1 Tax=Arthroderma uncinatum TaxID=74035 RepID=UPI00144A76A7|nr:serine/threonine protein kinase [Arthroderma uncinatum]KAF3492417.1 serine/threonine protein kinase [Arthroderma uncinatum]